MPRGERRLRPIAEREGMAFLDIPSSALHPARDKIPESHDIAEHSAGG
jgi:hypothetical protein